MEVKKATNNRRRRAGRKKKILSPNSLRVLQDIADQDWKVIESSTKRTISKLNDVGTGTVAPPHRPHPILQFHVGGGEEKVAEKLDETSATATGTFMTALPIAADSNSQEKSEQNAQKVTRELAQRKRTRLPTLGSQIDKDEDKPMESYAKEVLIYLASVMIR